MVSVARFPVAHFLLYNLVYLGKCLFERLSTVQTKFYVLSVAYAIFAFGQQHLIRINLQITLSSYGYFGLL